MDGMSGAVNGDVTSSATELLKHGAGWCIFYLINNTVICAQGKQKAIFLDIKIKTMKYNKVVF